jgi:hypothetical protein
MLYLNGLENFFLSSGSEEFVNTWYRKNIRWGGGGVSMNGGSLAGWFISRMINLIITMSVPV